MSIFLEIKQLRKQFGATVALKNVSFKVEKGSIHALIGENGAGKSTLIKSLSGLITPDSGMILLNGQSYRPSNIVNARMSGVSTAFQELSLLPNLTVAENLSLPRLKRDPLNLVSKQQNESYAKELLRVFDLEHIDPSREVGSLTLAEKQKLEITRAISHQPKLLLLDEPTAALPDPEWLFRSLQKVKSPEMTILYISHRLNEIRHICDSATILRNGSSIETVPLENVSNADIFQMMIGGETADTASDREGVTGNIRGPGIEVKGLCGSKINQVSFTLHKGEILGIAGLEGQGQSELFRILAGIEPLRSGQVIVDGKPVKIRGPLRALKYGITFVPEERKVEGILPGIKTLSNMTLSSLKHISWFGVIRKGKEYQSCLSAAQKVQLDPRYLNMDIDSLSGGNQQKAIMARSLMTGAQNLLLYDPSRGVDIGTKQTFYHMMNSFCEEGGSVLWYSTDLSELVHLCDRCLVFYKGSIVAEVSRNEMDMEILLSAATGHFHDEEVAT